MRYGTLRLSGDALLFYKAIPCRTTGTTSNPFFGFMTALLTKEGDVGLRHGGIVALEILLFLQYRLFLCIIFFVF